MKKFIFLFLIFLNYFFYVKPTEFEKLLKQCFALKKIDEAYYPEEVKVKKELGEKYSIDANGQVLLLKCHLKIPNNIILNLKNFKYIEGVNTQLIVDKSALLKIESECLFGKNISFIFHGFSKKIVNGKYQYCLNNIDIKTFLFFYNGKRIGNKLCISLCKNSDMNSKKLIRTPEIIAGEFSRYYEINT